MAGRIEDLEGVIANNPADLARDTIKATAAEVGRVAGASPIRSKLSRARRALKGNSPDREKAAGELAKALELFAADVAWRVRAKLELALGLAEYDAAIHDTIGVRQQERLTEEQAEEVAVCQSFHRDISLDF